MQRVKHMDIVTVGHAVADIILKPVPDNFFQIDAVNIPSISTVTGGDGHNTLAVIVTANRSAQERRWLKVEY